MKRRVSGDALTLAEMVALSERADRETAGLPRPVRAQRYRAILVDAGTNPLECLMAARSLRQKNRAPSLVKTRRYVVAADLEREVQS